MAFFNPHGVDIFLFSEKFPNPGQAFRFASYIIHRNDRLTARAVHPYWSAWYTVPLIVHFFLDQLEVTASSLTLTDKPSKPCGLTLAFAPLIGADLTTRFGGRFSVLLVGGLNAKHVDWNSGLSTRRKKPVREHADENS